jgi:hypothetical protein
MYFSENKFGRTKCIRFVLRKILHSLHRPSRHHWVPLMSLGSKAVKITETYSFSVAVQPKLGLGHLSVKFSKSHTDTSDKTALNE